MAMDRSLGRAERGVLRAVAKAGRPVGWFGVEIRLGMHGIVPEASLLEILGALVEAGLLGHGPVPDHPHGVYTLTDAG
jgi:hypothetical protein